jgi:urease accessory protein
MRIPLAEVGRRGRMDLVFAEQNGQTVLHNAYCEIPFKVTRILNSRQGPAHLILMHCTAGLFGGDELECSIQVKSGAQVLVTQQSATKIHPSAGRPAIQTNHIVVETGAELRFYLEPVIPFEESVLRQMTTIDVQPGGRLMFWEGLMAGRVGRGERWRFGQVASETQLRLDDHLVFLDRFILPPDEVNGSPSPRGNLNYLGTGLYVGDQAKSFATMLHDAVSEAGVDTPVAGVAVTRMVSTTGPDFHRCREMFCLHASRTAQLVMPLSTSRVR